MDKNRAYDYFSDEELDAFITEMEAEPLRQAPDYLKGIILKQAGRLDEPKITTIADARIKKPFTRADARKQLIDYGIKVCAGAAAAIAIMFVIPTVNGMQQGAQVNDSIQQSIIQEQQEQQEDRTQKPTEDDEQDRERRSVFADINDMTSNFCSHLFDKTNEIIKGGK